MLFEHDAHYYAEQVRSGIVTASELVERALANIQQLNPILNAVTIVQATTAREQARQQDRQLQAMPPAERQQLPPFWGVPTLLKDLGQHQQGQPATEGSYLVGNYIAKRNDHFVTAVEAAGFIIVGRTNTPEFGFKNISDSKRNGRVNSPFDKERNAGGSSGGAGAALKAGIVPIVMASDGGGSIRIPASFNGLIGLKPSRGRIPVGPTNYRGWQGASINFALTRSVRDTWTLLKSLQVEQYEAPFMLPRIQQTRLQPLTQSLRIAYTFETPFGEPVSSDARAAVEVAITHLRAQGHILVEARPTVDGERLIRDYYLVNGVETAAMMTHMGHPPREAMELMTWAIYQLGLSVSAVEYTQLLTRWDYYGVALERFYREYDALLMPTTNGGAPRHDAFTPDATTWQQLQQIDQYEQAQRLELICQMFQKGLDYTPFGMQMNLAGQPAISLPIAQTAEGLPIGIQLSSAKGQDYLLLQLAQQFEQAGMLDSRVVEVRKSTL